MEFNEKPFRHQSGFHLAGIVPIAAPSLGFDMDWHDCMMPIAPNYTLVESAVYECAMAGCETIWIICNDDTSPLIRYRIGDYIEDPVWASRKYSSKPREERIKIPIFYVPVHPKDRDKRDCLSWSVLYGALTCLKVSTQISKWLTPDKYYVSFPYSVLPVEEIRAHRKSISSKDNFYIIYNGKTVQDNYYSSFTFGKEEFIKYRRIIRKEGTGMYSTEILNDKGIPRSLLPIEQRWSARFFELEKVFTDLDLKSATLFEPSWYYNVGSWEEYKFFLSSEQSKTVVRPWERILKYREFNPVGVDEE